MTIQAFRNVIEEIKNNRLIPAEDCVKKAIKDHNDLSKKINAPHHCLDYNYFNHLWEVLQMVELLTQQVPGQFTREEAIANLEEFANQLQERV